MRRVVVIAVVYNNNNNNKQMPLSSQISLLLLMVANIKVSRLVRSSCRLFKWDPGALELPSAGEIPTVENCVVTVDATPHVKCWQNITGSESSDESKRASCPARHSFTLKKHHQNMKKSLLQHKPFWIYLVSQQSQCAFDKHFLLFYLYLQHLSSYVCHFPDKEPVKTSPFSPIR